MSVNIRIRQARLDLQINEKSLADRAGLTVYELGDVEARDDEFSTCITAQSAIKLCRELKIPVAELLGIPDESVMLHDSLKNYIRTIRLREALTPEQLDDRVGYEHGFIEKVEAGMVDLKEYPLELTMDIAIQTKSSRMQMLRVLEREIQ